MTPWDLADPLDVIVLVPFFIAVVYLVFAEWRSDRRTRHAQSPTVPSLVPPPPDAAPPIYVHAVCGVADSQSCVGDSVVADEMNGTVRLTLVKR